MRKKIFSFLIFSFCSLLLFNFSLTTVNAQNLNDAFKVSDGGNKDNLDSLAAEAGYKTSSEVSLYKNISDIINLSLSFLGVIFIILMIYGGWLWMSDQGNEDQVAKAKKIISAAIVGVIIIISSYAISWFIISALSKKVLQGE
jgi:hypothetical protein